MTGVSGSRKCIIINIITVWKLWLQTVIIIFYVFSGSRFHVTHDFGFVTLDIHSVITEDSGVYMCKAVNNAGEAVSSTSLKVKCKFYVTGTWMNIVKCEEEMLKYLTERLQRNFRPCNEVVCK